DSPSEMLSKGDRKFRLTGKKLNGEFVLARMRSRRRGSKGTEWLLIKKRDAFVQEGFDANSPKYDGSVVSGRSLEEIASDDKSAEWERNRPAAKANAKVAWLEGPLRNRARSELSAANVQDAEGTKEKTRTGSA